MKEQESQNLLAENPYYIPVGNIWRDLCSIKYKPPWLPFFVEAIVLIFLIILFAILYVTVGILSQIHQILMQKVEEIKVLIADSSSTVQKSAWTISLGIYYIIALPLWVIQWPFYYLGWAGHKSRPLLILSLFIICVLSWCLYHEKSITELTKQCYSFIESLLSGSNQV